MNRSLALVVALVLALAVASPAIAGRRGVYAAMSGLSESSYQPGGGADCTFGGFVDWWDFRDTDYTAKVDLLKDGVVVANFSSLVTGAEGRWTSPELSRTATVDTRHTWEARGSIWSIKKHPREIEWSTNFGASLYCE